jgi:tetratricopeptide (TPR) repeat protein
MKNKKNIIFLILLFLLSSVVLLAQEGRGKGRLAGKIVDETGNPIEGVIVEAQSLNFSLHLKSKTNAKGEWAILGMGTGMFRFSFKKKGYFPVYVDRYIKQLALNKNLDVTLKKSPMATITDDKTKETVKKSNKFFDEGKYKEAIDVLKPLVEKDKELFFLKLNIANCYRKMGDEANALKYYEELIKDTEGKNGSYIIDLLARTYASLGEIYGKDKKYDKAIEAFEKAAKLYSKDEKIMYNLGELYFNQFKTAKAIEYLKKAIEINPNWGKPYSKLGYAYLNAGDIKKSVETFENYLKQFPNAKDKASIEKMLPGLKKTIK